MPKGTENSASTLRRQMKRVGGLGLVTGAVLTGGVFLGAPAFAATVHAQTVPAQVVRQVSRTELTQQQFSRDMVVARAVGHTTMAAWHRHHKSEDCEHGRHHRRHHHHKCPCRRGPRGPRGPQGPAVTPIVITGAPGAGTSTALCPTGMFATGGGFSTTGGNPSDIVRFDGPVGGSPATGWQAVVTGPGEGPTPTVTAYAVCIA